MDHNPQEDESVNDINGTPDSENLDNNFFQDNIEHYAGEQGHDNFNYANRIHSIHRNEMYSGQSHNVVQSFEARTGGLNGKTFCRYKQRGDMVDSIEYHADLIVAKMEQDPVLMEDSPTSEELRKEALRDMPQCLSLKKCVKAKLLKTVSQKSKKKPLGCWKMFKYQTSFSFSKLKLNMKNLVYSFELWYSALKQIEGNFGSGVASFFKFLRWIFILNLFITVISFAFIVLPQITFDNNHVTSTDFDWTDIFTGEGYFTNTILYYGFYSNQSVSSVLTYSMPDAYFFTMMCLYLCCFAVFSISVAASYRRSFIETEGGLKNIFAHKIFCGWDYNIATYHAAQLKSHSIYNELRELLYDTMNPKTKASFIVIFWTRTMQLAMNALIILTLIGCGYLMWFLMEKSNKEHWPSIYTPLAVNVIMTILPIIFSYLIKYEDYGSPRKILYFTLIRSFLLGFVIIGVLVSFWLKNPDNECWETSLGQEVYRLILFDFIFSIIISPLFDLTLYAVSRYLDKGYLQFDIARNTMQVIYNQTLFWVGLYFSPLLPVIVSIKLLLLWYVRKAIALKCCKPSPKSWRAAQTTTWFLMMTFLSLLLVGGVLGYIIAYTPTTNCGPFNEYSYMYEIVVLGILHLKKNSSIWKYTLFVTKPGVIALILVALCARVYYLQAKAQAQRGIVAIYREMLIWESRDKEFLLQNISLVTKGQWQYKLLEGREINPIVSLPDGPRYRGPEGGDNIITKESSDILSSTISSLNSSPSSSISGLELDTAGHSDNKKNF